MLSPVTRVGGALAVRVETDGTQLTDAHVMGTFFRGYENILAGRDPRDALAVSSRVCGWDGAIHQTTASIMLEMALGVTPPSMASALRSLAECTEAIWIHAANLAVRAGPDFCAPIVRRTTPWLWDMASRTAARDAGVHGFETIGEIMEAMTPITGRYWYDTIPVGRKVLEMINLIYGKYPHPSVLEPAGVGSTLTVGNFTEYYTRLYRAVDYVKQTIAMWDDLIDFLLAADPRFVELGARPMNFIQTGAWELQPAEGRYDTLDEDGRRRLARPGVIIDGELATDSLTEINRGIEESVAHSYYGDWTGGGTDPAGAPLPARHPWDKSTIPAPDAPNLGGRYSWSTAPRWQGHVVETGPLGRLWLAATRTDFPENQFIEPTGRGIRILVPKNFLPETIVEWHIPERVNALERLRADAYGIAFAGLCGALALLKGFELTRRAETAVSNRFEITDQPLVGVGLWESGRGANAHWMRGDGGRMRNYQVVGPSTWNASPRDEHGNPGPLEESLIGSPVIEEPFHGPLTGIDALRVVHSIDPCMNCGVH